MPADRRYGGVMASEEQVYEVVAARRLQWDQLVWQVPVLSLTAQAFLFTIALGGGNTCGARVVAALLSLIATFMSIELMSRHRQAEIADAHWLEAYEREHFPEDERYVVHGQAFRANRNLIPPGPLGRLPGYWTWTAGLTLFGGAALFALLAAILYPTLLH